MDSPETIRVRTSASMKVNTFSPYKNNIYYSLSNFLHNKNRLKTNVRAFFDFGFTICGLAHLRNLRICNSGISPRICGFAFACPPLVIYLYSTQYNSGLRLPHHFHADPYASFHFNADPDPDPAPRQNNRYESATTGLQTLTAPRLQCERPRPS
jgi:hypothetical protein